MKRSISIFALVLLIATALAAQEQAPKPDYNTNRDYGSRVFQIVHRDPRAIASAVQLLGSGFAGADISVNNDLGTITVRDFPENLATIDEAIGRLDRPEAKEPDIQIKISILIGSRSPLNDGAVPEDLAGVVKQLQSTLTYTHYGLMTATLHRTRGGAGLEGSGVAEPALFGTTAAPKQPVMYRYALRRVSASAESVDISTFQFSMQIPIETTEGTYQYQPVGFETPVSLRPKEKVVIGTTTMGEKALIVVVTATVENAG